MEPILELLSWVASPKIIILWLDYGVFLNIVRWSMRYLFLRNMASFWKNIFLMISFITGVMSFLRFVRLVSNWRAMLELSMWGNAARKLKKNRWWLNHFWQYSVLNWQWISKMKVKFIFLHHRSNHFQYKIRRCHLWSSRWTNQPFLHNFHRSFRSQTTFRVSRS